MAHSHEMTSRKPPGIRLFGGITVLRTYQTLVLVLTFVAYTCFHMTRKIPSIVKSVLDPQTKLGSSPWGRLHTKNTLNIGWLPFNTIDGSALLGEIDVAFLAVYSVGMFFAGHLGDRMDLRIFLTIGMFGTAVFTALFGAGYWLNIHNFYYFLVIQMIAGLFQAIGWPSVVAIVGNWFGKSKRGLIMGIWNAHTSVGNISGSLLAAFLLKFGWGWSFAIPSLIMVAVGLLVFGFLPVSPEVMEIDIDDGEISSVKDTTKEPLLEPGQEVKHNAVGFLEAWKIPGVAPFALCLFFSKLVAYTFLYWLPFYISHTPIGGEYLSDALAGSLSTIFDVGGVLGGVLAGHISDRLNARAVTAASFMYCAIPALFLYRTYGSMSIMWNICLMFITGMFVNGPYALITTAVSADLGTHSSLNGNSRALATVTAIIDGTGSVGAAIGPLLTGYISSSSWSAVFTMLMAAALLAGLLLTQLVCSELKGKATSNASKDVADAQGTYSDEV
uniref:Major facilitator superfamily (MFS) profile domain-containing protein n=1 Tax=Oryza nivara TaxID=4536 RepID=A0A0E0I7D4_ORYNI